MLFVAETGARQYIFADIALEPSNIMTMRVLGNLLLLCFTRAYSKEKIILGTEGPVSIAVVVEVD